MSTHSTHAQIRSSIRYHGLRKGYNGGSGVIECTSLSERGSPLIGMKQGIRHTITILANKMKQNNKRSLSN